MSAELVLDAEVVPVIDHDSAVELDARIRDRVGRINCEIDELQADLDYAKHSGIHAELGFASWTAYFADVFTVKVRIDRKRRRELVGYLSGEGMSNRAIAEVIGVDEITVRRDKDSGATNVAPEPEPEPESVDATLIDTGECDVDDDEPADDDGIDEPEPEPEPAPVAPPEPAPPPTVTGLDGKTYPSKPTPKEPRRKPLTDAFDSATYELKRSVERVTRLAADDRFAKNKDQISGSNLSDLVRVRDAINGVIQQIEG